MKMAGGVGSGLLAMGLVATPMSVANAGAPAAVERAALPTSVAALGDSITRGFNACGFYRDCTSRSWSTGGSEQVDSHVSRLDDRGAKLTEANNFAADGARADSLAAQAEAAVAVAADYVTIEIGANDACRSAEDRMTPVAEYRAQIDAGLAVLRKGLPDARVFVASVPDVKRLWTVGHGHRLARYAWDKLKICQALLADANSDDKADKARRDRVRDRVKDYNRELKAACKAYGKACNYDGGAVFATPFTLDEVSKWDFFHPNTAGQKVLAKVTWEAGFRW